ncbi:MAG: NAD-glutamate dehydrogenase, partial [Alphaproteobacteria bacterium]
MVNSWLRKQKVLSALARYCADKTPQKDRADLSRFIDAFYADASPVDVISAPVERLYAIARRAWRDCASRKPDMPFIDIENRDGEDVMAADRTSIFIINDDKPFLVDSITSGLSALGHEIQLLYHPVIRVRRDKIGRRRETVGRPSPDTQSDVQIQAESIIYIEINRRGPRTCARIAEALGQVLADVYAAVADWRAMLSRLYDAARALEDRHGPIAPDLLAENVAFLDWLREDHFTLLGYRFYACTGDLTTPEVSVEPGEGLGILRDPERMIWRGAGGLTHMSQEHRHFLKSDDPILITKANAKATVHRRVHLDYVGVKAFDDEGRVTGEHRFVGLFTSSSYSRRARSIPLLRRKADEVIARAGFDPRGHAGKALDNILESFPRDELFQIDIDTLFETALGILYLQERPRSKVFVRRDAFERFVSVLAYVPRENYHGEIRAKIGDVLAQAFKGELSTYYVELSQELLARIHYIIRTRPGMVPDVDPDKLDERVADVVKGWRERLRDALIAAHGEEQGRLLYYSFEDAFPVAYRENFGAEDAVMDLAKLDSLDDAHARAYHLYRRDGDDNVTVRLKIYRGREIIALSDCLPMLEHLGLKVIEEVAYSLQGGKPCWIHDFLLRDASGDGIDVEAVRGNVEQALGLVTAGRIDDDGFNALILRGGLDADQVAILRAYGRYLRQLGLPFSQDYLEDCLVRHGIVAGKLVRLFEAQFDPDRPAKQRETRAQALEREIKIALEGVSSLDQDRILSNFLNLMQATVRTNYFQRGPD